MEKDRRETRETEWKKLKEDTEKLFQGASELKDLIEKSNKDTLSIQVLKKADEGGRPSRTSGKERRMDFRCVRRDGHRGSKLLRREHLHCGLAFGQPQGQRLQTPASGGVADRLGL